MICSVLIHSLGISLLCFSLKSDYRTSVKMQGGGGGRDIPVIDLKSLVKAIILFSWITTQVLLSSLTYTQVGLYYIKASLINITIYFNFSLLNLIASLYRSKEKFHSDFVCKHLTYFLTNGNVIVCWSNL